MKYKALCIRNYDPKRAKEGKVYPIKQVSRWESYVILPRGRHSIEHPSFDRYFEIVEEE